MRRRLCCSRCRREVKSRSPPCSLRHATYMLHSFLSETTLRSNKLSKKGKIGFRV